MSTIQRERLPNGLWLLAEPMEGVESVAMSLLLPAGAATEGAEDQGVAALLAEMMCRGAGDLDRLGVDRGTSVQVNHLTLGASMIGSKLPDALPLLLNMARRPRLGDDSLEPSRDLAVQSIESLEDEPQQKVMLELRRLHHPAPFGRSPLGQLPALERLTADDVRGFWRSRCVPQGAVLAFAGKLQWTELREQVRRLTDDWTGDAPEPVELASAKRGYRHEKAESTQVHIGLACDAPPEPDADAMTQRAAVAVLSGGMSGRLFTEVREKRGLCYSVYASYAAGRDRGAVFAYSGTTAARAQETLDVLTAELRRIEQGVSDDEFARAIVGMKSRLVMQGESTGARAAALAGDQYTLGRPRTLDEVAAQVDAVTAAKVNDYLKRRPAGKFTVVTVGPEALKV